MPLVRDILFNDGWAIAGFVFFLLGTVIGVVGAALALSSVTVFVGIPFAVLGALLLLAAVFFAGVALSGRTADRRGG
jgi:hypothetical protein